MEFFELHQNDVAHVVIDDRVVDTITIRDVSEEGRCVVMQSMDLFPGKMQELLYLPQGIVNINEQAYSVAEPGWRFLHQQSGSSKKVLYLDDYVYELRPVRSYGNNTRLQ